MIRKGLSVFIPEHVGNYYAMPTTVVGITIQENSLHATITSFSGNSTTIQKSITIDFDEALETKKEKTVAAIKDLFKKTGPYHHIVTTVPSSLVTFKELSFPFMDEDKIGMVVSYEIESMLPFSPQEACIDFITTKQYKEENRSDVMVAAVQKKWIDQAIAPFLEAGVEITSVSTDIIGFYNLYIRKTISESDCYAFLSIDSQTTKVGFFINGQLKHIRTIRKGINKGINNKNLWNDIKFTLQSFADDDNQNNKLKKITLFECGQEGLLEQAKQQLDMPCEIFNFNKVCTEANITKKQTLKAEQLSSFAATLTLPQGKDFSFLPPLATTKQVALFNRQTIIAICLPILTIAVLATHTFLQKRKLSAELKASQQQVVKVLKQNFPSIKGNSQRDAIDTAQREVHREENIWSSLSSQSRQSFLYYLSQLSTKIDRETLGLNLKKMVISKNIITLDGNVRNFEALAQFEHQLRETSLFVNVPDMQKIDFSLQLPINNEGAI